jgi:hypothetical protein
MSLQELTHALRQKSDEKAVVIKSIQDYQSLSIQQAVIGRLIFQVTDCFFENINFDVEIHPETASVAVGKTDLTNKVQMCLVLLLLLLIC